MTLQRLHTPAACTPADPGRGASRGCGVWALALALLLAACGGGDGGSSGARLGPASNDGLPRIEPYERTAPRALLALRAAPAAPVLRALPIRVSLGALPAEADGPPVGRGAASARGIPIGLVRPVGATADAAATAAALHWQALPEGGQVAALTFHSQAAAALRLGLEVSALPTGTQLSIHATGLDTSADAGPRARQLSVRELMDTLDRNRRSGDTGPAGRIYWAPSVGGEEVTLQIELPPGADPASVALAVPRLSHQWWTHTASPKASAVVMPKSADACNIDVTCEPQYAAEARSVARLEVVSSSDNRAYLCTGTLMADTAASQTPYFLTAHHCVGNQTEASSVETYWFYRSASCGSSTPDPGVTQVLGGATLLYASASSDVSFMRLAGSPPVGAVHAGSILSLPALNTALAGLHHPAGDLLKLSEGTLNAYGSCQGTLCGANNHTDGNFLVLRWSRGTTQEGSSGSGVFATVGSRRYLVGHLFAGSASCSDPSAKDFYGRFDRAYPSLRTWLGSPPGS